MCAVKTSLTQINKQELGNIIKTIKQTIPTGFTKHNKRQQKKLMPCTEGLFINSVVLENYKKAQFSLGTLGGGNHFIEIQKGSDNHIWIMIHSGSRNLGKQVAEHYNKIAKQLNKKWHSCVDKKYDLAFLPVDSKAGKDYILEMNYCIAFAKANRKHMMDAIKKIFIEVVKTENLVFENTLDIAHNYCKIEHHFGKNVMIHRKGATRANKDELGIIPGSQGTSSYIVKGLGNKESFMSCSHGAGRLMGRKQAKQTLDLQTEINKLDKLGIIHSLESVDNLDEATGAYKDISEVMENQYDLVEPIVELKCLAVVKA